MFSKNRYLVMSWPIDITCQRVLRDICGLSKKCSVATFPKIQPELCQFECQKYPKIQQPLKKQTSRLSVFHLDIHLSIVVANGFMEKEATLLCVNMWERARAFAAITQGTTFYYRFCHYKVQFLWYTFQWHGNEAFPKDSS